MPETARITEALAQIVTVMLHEGKSVWYATLLLIWPLGLLALAAVWDIARRWVKAKGNGDEVP